MKDELFRKLMNEESLTMAEALELEQQLESGDHIQLSETISELPDEEVSLEWRSQLNEQLQLSAPKPKKNPFKWFYACGAAVAACALGIVLMNKPAAQSAPVAVTPEEEAKLEAILVEAHHRDERGIVIPASTTDSGFDWSQF